MKIAIPLAANIPPITAVPITLLEIAPDPEALQRGTQPRINANEVMRIGLSLSFAPTRAASASDLPFSYSALAKFNDQYGILRRQADQHDETDLSINIVLKRETLKPAQIKGRESSENCDWHAQQNTKRQSPALVKPQE